MNRYFDIKLLSFFILTGILLSCKSKEIPVIMTDFVSSVTAISATCGGTIEDDGGAEIISRGVCWSIYANPTSSNSKTVLRNDDNPFECNINGLIKGTTYHVRAFATNSAGTAYGEDVTFTTKIADADGNIYNTVTIGTQIWMVGNLKTTKYNDFRPIYHSENSSEWANIRLGAYCWYENDDVSYNDMYGALYNWYAVVDNRKLCPVGWHVPTDEDWTILTDYLGGIDVAGGKLKETGTGHWDSPNEGATNETGFTALPGGNRTIDGLFGEIRTNGYWWSATQLDATFALGRSMRNSSDSVMTGTFNKRYGFPVRCIKD